MTATSSAALVRGVMTRTVLQLRGVLRAVGRAAARGWRHFWFGWGVR